jgi:hypothetical protein
MTSPRSEEIKLGAEKPLKPEEVKRCELKPIMEIKRTACIRCGGRVLLGQSHPTTTSRRRRSQLPSEDRSVFGA